MAMNMEGSPQFDGACDICRRTIGKIAVMTVDRRHGSLENSGSSRAGLTKLQPVGTT
jgi:hypothetical protein